MVVGRFFQDPSFPTVTVYNHLDVQPADGEGWRTPPFKLTRDASGAGGPARWFARGATDDKGPALTALYGARLAIENGVRANIQFLWELEEEIGSPHFAAGLAAAVAGDAATGRAPFATDSVVVSDTIWIAAGQPSISYGLRGLMGFTVALETGAKDVHSGTTGGLARNPIGELAALVAECYDARTGKVKIPGFYADVRKLSAAERKAFARARFSRKRFAAAHELGSLRPIRDDLAGLVALTAAPTLEVHGLVGGYAGPGHQDHRPPPRRAEAVDAPGPRSEAGQGVQPRQALHQVTPARRRGHARGVAGAVSRADGRPHQRRRRGRREARPSARSRRSCAKGDRSARS